MPRIAASIETALSKLRHFHPEAEILQYGGSLTSKSLIRCQHGKVGSHSIMRLMSRGACFCQRFAGLANAIYLWRVASIPTRADGASVYKIGVGTFGKTLARCKAVTKAGGLAADPPIVCRVAVGSAYTFEQQILDRSEAYDFNHPFQGHTEFRWLAPSDLRFIHCLLSGHLIPDETPLETSGLTSVQTDQVRALRSDRMRFLWRKRTYREKVVAAIRRSVTSAPHREQQRKGTLSRFLRIEERVRHSERVRSFACTESHRKKLADAIRKTWIEKGESLRMSRRTLQARANYALSAKKTWSCPARRARQSLLAKSRMENPEFRSHLSHIARIRLSNPGAVENLRRKALAQWADADSREKLLASRRTAEAVAKLKSSQSAFWARPENRERRSQRTKLQMASPEMRSKIGAKTRSRYATAEARAAHGKTVFRDAAKREAHSARMRALWGDPDWRAVQTAKIRAARSASLSSDTQ